MKVAGQNDCLDKHRSISGRWFWRMLVETLSGGKKELQLCCNLIDENVEIFINYQIDGSSALSSRTLNTILNFLFNDCLFPQDVRKTVIVVVQP